jgi:hypothetical protein
MHALSFGYSHGYLDNLKPGSPRCKRWEETILDNFANREGWVACNNVLGSGAWNDEVSNSSSGNTSGTGLFSQIQQRYQQGSTNSSQPSAGPSHGIASSSTDTEVPSFPMSGGHMLGSASRRPASAADDRQARLKAIERRMEAASTVDIV